MGIQVLKIWLQNVGTHRPQIAKSMCSNFTSNTCRPKYKEKSLSRGNFLLWRTVTRSVLNRLIRLWLAPKTEVIYQKQV